MKKKITVKASSVLEARPLAELVALAGKYKSSICITMDDRMVNAKSIMGIMGLGLDTGKQIVLEAEGDDAKEAVEAMEEFLTT